MGGYWVHEGYWVLCIHKGILKKYSNPVKIDTLSLTKSVESTKLRLLTERGIVLKEESNSVYQQLHITTQSSCQCIVAYEEG